MELPCRSEPPMLNLEFGEYNRVRELNVFVKYVTGSFYTNVIVMTLYAQTKGNDSGRKDVSYILLPHTKSLCDWTAVGGGRFLLTYGISLLLQEKKSHAKTLNGGLYLREGCSCVLRLRAADWTQPKGFSLRLEVFSRDGTWPYSRGHLWPSLQVYLFGRSDLMGLWGSLPDKLGARCLS